MKCLFVYNKISGGSKEVSYHEEIIKYLNNIYDYVDLFEPNVGKDISTVLSCNNYAVMQQNNIKTKKELICL